MNTKIIDPYQQNPYWKYLALLAGWLAWTFDGLIQNIYNIVSREALKELIPEIKDQVTQHTELTLQSKSVEAAGQSITGISDQLLTLTNQIDASVGWYFSLSIAMWLWGAAAGGVLFGRLGDQYGRSRTLIFAVITYCSFTALSAASTHWTLFCLCRFLGALGLGGAWPLSLALMVETWDPKHRPWLAGLIGAGANVGYLIAAYFSSILTDMNYNWQSIIVASSLISLSCLVLIFFVPEPTQWLQSKANKEHSSLADLFDSKYRRATIIGLLLAMVALMGTWGTFLWMPIYVEQLVENSDVSKAARSWQSFWQSFGQIFGGFFGGMIAGWMGIKRSYAFLCIAAWASVVSLFWFNDEYGLQMILMGTVAGVFVTAFFGWLPKYLSELFPTRIRATGQGFCYNGGRIVAGLGVLGTGYVVSMFDGNYKMGVMTTATIYLTGLIVILFAPSPSPDQEDE